MTLEEFKDLKRKLETLRKERDRCDGAIDEKIKQLKEQFACPSLEEGEKLLEEKKKKLARRKEEFDKQWLEFSEKWKDRKEIDL